VGGGARKTRASSAPNDTIVIITADNGAWQDAWPDAGTHPFRGEKGSPFEAGWRVPGNMWAPGKVPAGAGPPRNDVAQGAMTAFNGCLLLRAGWIEGAAPKDVGGLGVRACFIELPEEVLSREPLVTGRAGIKASQSRAIQIGNVIGGHRRQFVSVKIGHELLIVVGAVGC
jgi:hypothetical protein